jgi:hypothetical protein
MNAAILFYRQRSSRTPCAAMTASWCFCFARPEDAEAFAERFGGELFRAGR